MMYIMTHRGLDPSIKNYFTESSIEAFEDQLSRGFGLEFDLQITRDNKIIILHDNTLGRISQGKDNRKICDVTAKEVLDMKFNGCHITSLDTLLALIDNKQKGNAISSIHIKHELQSKDLLDIILSYLEKQDLTKFILFDLKTDTAVYLREKNKKIQLAPSVAHPFDIKRYNSFVGGTLLTIETALESNLFDWVWLDEWDKNDEDNQEKIFYSEVLFKKIRDKGIKIALVTPDLHSTSPSLLGKEHHADADDMDKLKSKIDYIIKLNPDAVCTDYPDLTKDLTHERKN